jgi:hypothetical protein
MCFTPHKKTKIRVARKDIFVLKYFESNKYFSTHSPIDLVTGYMGTEVPVDGMLIAKPATKNIDWESNYIPEMVEGNAIHSLSLNTLYDLNKHFMDNSIACVCIIPKGTKFANNNYDYISEKLLVLHEHRISTYRNSYCEMLTLVDNIIAKYKPTK